MARPGTMMYYNEYKRLKELEKTDSGAMQIQPAQRLAILDAYMEYAENGIKPEFKDPFLIFIWEFGKYEIMADTDNKRYQKRVNDGAKGGNAKAINAKQQTEDDSRFKINYDA